MVSIIFLLNSNLADSLNIITSSHLFENQMSNVSFLSLQNASRQRLKYSEDLYGYRMKEEMKNEEY